MPSKKPKAPPPKNYAQRRAQQQKTRAESRLQRQARLRKIAARRKHFDERDSTHGHKRWYHQPVKQRHGRKRPQKPAQILDAYLAGTLEDDQRIERYAANFKKIVGAVRCARPVELEQFRALVRLVQQRMPKLMTPNMVLLLGEIDRIQWVQPLEQWQSRRRSPKQRFRSLVEHLLARYPVPTVIIHELIDLSQQATPLDQEQRLRLTQRVRMVAKLGMGSGMRGLQKEGMLPSTLTRKMLHRLSTHTDADSLIEATRAVQVEAYGGSPETVAALKETFLGRSRMDDETFWSSVIHWVCRNQGALPERLGPLLDHIRTLHQEATEEGLQWSIKGRSVAALLRSMIRWHIALNAIARLKAENFGAAGLKGYELIRRVGAHTHCWTIAEIRTATELAQEGRELHHCVASYANRIQGGMCSIWSVRCNGVRVLTAEVSGGRVVQVAGKANRRATPAERRLINLWAESNGLR